MTQQYRKRLTNIICSVHRQTLFYDTIANAIESDSIETRNGINILGTHKFDVFRMNTKRNDWFVLPP